MLGAVALKAVTMATLLWLVIRANGLTDFEKGLIIAAVSATITGGFTVLGAWLAARIAAEKVDSMADDVHAVKRKVGATKREGERNEG